ncbi:KH domain-containing protein [Candidatus Microgenomates bacterium]|nr:KH domain-containing protein [Candidatus Microgenomates bacterium]
MTDDIKTIVQEETNKLLELLKVTATFEVEELEEDSFKVKLETDEAGILIGYHGETLASLQLILGLIIHKKTDQWVRVLLEVGDWRQRREESLKEMALKIADRVEVSGEATPLPRLNSAERRFIHLVLKDHPKVMTESQGEGEERYLIIKPK